jgi:hypothetical protein
MQVIIESRIDPNLKKRFLEGNINQILHNDDNYEKRRNKFKISQTSKYIRRETNYTLK